VPETGVGSSASEPTTGVRHSLLAEAVATFAVALTTGLVLCGDSLERNQIGPVGQSLAVAAVSAAALTGSARRSPGLANPTVVLALFSIGRLSIGQTLRLLVTQLLAAVVAGLLTRTLFPEEVLYLGPRRHVEVNFAQAIEIEFLLGFLTVWALLAATRFKLGAVGEPRAIWPRPGVTASIAGLMTLIGGIGAGRLTGGYANPARAASLAVAGWTLHGQTYYWLGPIAGAWLAAVCVNVCLRPR
jgi:glycerol uptake facilitator-like aquaporin